MFFIFRDSTALSGGFYFVKKFSRNLTGNLDIKKKMDYITYTLLKKHFKKPCINKRKELRTGTKRVHIAGM